MPFAATTQLAVTLISAFAAHLLVGKRDGPSAAYVGCQTGGLSAIGVERLNPRTAAWLAAAGAVLMLAGVLCYFASLWRAP